MGFSDGSTFNSMFYKAGVMSFYGPNVLTTLSEPVKLHDYTTKWIKKVLFCDEVIGQIDSAPCWTAEAIDWSSTIEKQREMTPNSGYEILQGSGKVTGHIVGGCTGPLQLMKGTCLFPSAKAWENSIIFLEGIIPF